MPRLSEGLPGSRLELLRCPRVGHGGSDRSGGRRAGLLDGLDGLDGLYHAVTKFAKMFSACSVRTAHDSEKGCRVPEASLPKYMTRQNLAM